MILIGAWAGCGLGEEPLRVEGDPRLDELSGRDGGVADPDAAEPDAEAPALDLGFRCAPACLDDQFCGPDGVCFERRARCGVEGETCDAGVTPRTPEFVCEAVFGASVGVCRRICEPGDPSSCPESRACGLLYAHEDVSICRRQCQGDDELCGPLDRCIGGAFGLCRGQCRPFFEGQCPAGAGCAPSGAEHGSCQTIGAAVEGEVCEQEICGEGLRCTTTGAEDRCMGYCAEGAAAGDPGGCDEGWSCDLFVGVDIGVCRKQCDLFDTAQVCDDPAQGCLVSSGRGGVCVWRGRVAQGNRCQSTTQCVSPLQCLQGAGEAVCERLCLLEAEEGEVGRCPRDQSCAMAGFGDIGVCR